jgi:signal transduction histidine kinase
VSWNRRPVRRGAFLGAVAFAFVTLLVSAKAGAPAQFLAADALGGLTFLGAGMLAWERRPEVRSGPLLVASGVLWFVGSYAPTGFAPYDWLGFAFQRYYDVLLALLVLTFPAVPLGRSGRAVLLVLAGGFVARSLARLLLGHPEAPANPIALAVNGPLFDQLQLLTSGVIVLAALAVALLALRRLRAATGAARRYLWPVVAAGSLAALSAAYAALQLIAFLAAGGPLLDVPEPWHEIVGWLPFVAVALVPFGFLIGSLRLRLSRGRIAPLALELDRGADQAGLQAALRHALGDPSVELYISRREGSGWLDATGSERPLPTESPSRALTVLQRDGEPIAAVAHDPLLREDPGLVAAATAVLRLAVENERLAADLRQQLEQVRASRARLVEAGERERRRIERDLHDGAQQRLLAVAMQLEAARQQARREDPQATFLSHLDETSETLLAAIDELREIARGIHPAVLTEAGLGVAVSSLARRAAIPVSLDLRLNGRLPGAVEAAAYYVVAEALTNITRHARASAARVSLDLAAGFLEVEVADDGDGGADSRRGSGLRGLADRLDAVSGSLEVDSPPLGGTRLKARIPCV